MSKSDSNSARMTSTRFFGLLLLATLLIGWMLKIFILDRRIHSSAPVVFKDGSTFELRVTAFSKGFHYEHRSGPVWIEKLAPIIPYDLELRLPGVRGGTLSFGGAATNLILITVLDKSTRQSWVNPQRLRILDGDGNAYDSNWGANTMGINHVSVQGWEVPMFPRRSKTLIAQFLGKDTNDQWTEIARFPIQNQMFLGESDETWKPETLPAIKKDRDLSIKLIRFESGMTLPEFDPKNPLSPRFTQMEFQFETEGNVSDAIGIQKIRLSDVTGNEWSPHLDLLKASGWNYAQHGFVQFFGGLWPDESAWKIKLEAMRIRDHDPVDVWEVGPIDLPSAGQSLDLTNSFKAGETEITIATIHAPGVQTTNEWRWIVRYWGNEQNVYPMGIAISQGLNARQIIVTEAKDETGERVPLVEHHLWAGTRQALFFNMPTHSRQLNLKLALPKVYQVEFLARPNLVE